MLLKLLVSGLLLATTVANADEVVPKIKHNHVLLHLGAGITENEAWFDGNQIQSNEVLGFIFGLQYTRTELFQIANKEIGWSIAGFSHKTYLTGPQVKFDPIAVGLLVGRGVVDIEVGADVSDPFNPRLTEEVIEGFVAGVQLQYQLFPNLLIHGTATSNLTFTGGIGISF